MKNIQAIENLLRESVDPVKENNPVFFKTGPGQYAEHDQFLGVSIPNLRKIAKEFHELPIEEIHVLIHSPINDKRMLALFILISQYKKADQKEQETIYQFYLQHLQHINNWNLVDASAHWIIGAHVFQDDREILFQLSHSNSLWERRIAIVSTWYFIKQKDLTCTFELAAILLNDKEDLIHKAVGWMLREAGKVDQEQLILFLNQNSIKMPRTMLRYSIERFPEPLRKRYLNFISKNIEQ